MSDIERWYKLAYRGYTEAQNRATQKYHKEKLEQIAIRVHSGKRDRYNALAKIKKTSLASLITELLEELIKEEGLESLISEIVQNAKNQEQSESKQGDISAEN